MSDKETIERPQPDNKITYLGQLFAFFAQMGGLCTQRIAGIAQDPATVDRSKTPGPMEMKR
jgi:hypothetical protein